MHLSSVLQRKDYGRAIRFASIGMHFERYLSNRVLRYLYARYFLLDEILNATDVIAAYEDDKLKGLLMARIEGSEERSSGAIASRLYVRLFSLLQGTIAGRGTDAYELANKEMLKEYSSKYLLAGEVIFLAVDPTSHGQGIGRMLIEELSRRHKGQRIYLFTDSGCSYGFYEHMGFVRVGERDIMMNILSKDVPLKCLLYSKEL